MKRSKTTMVALAVVLGSWAMAWHATAESTPVAPAAGYTAALKNDQGEDVGTVSFTDAPKGLLMNVSIDKMAPGWHAIHLHGKGDCSDMTDHFKMSGGHMAREGEEHGFFNPKGPHAGDFANFFVGGDGKAKFEQYSTNVRAADLPDADGTAVIIHAKPDDYMSQPAGDAGERLACGVVAAAK